MQYRQPGSRKGNALDHAVTCRAHIGRWQVLDISRVWSHGIPTTMSWNVFFFSRFHLQFEKLNSYPQSQALRESFLPKLWVERKSHEFNSKPRTFSWYTKNPRLPDMVLPLAAALALLLGWLLTWKTPEMGKGSDYPFEPWLCTYIFLCLLLVLTSLIWVRAAYC